MVYGGAFVIVPVEGEMLTCGVTLCLSETKSIDVTFELIQWFTLCLERGDSMVYVGEL
jgi:hypothetical protein